MRSQSHCVSAGDARTWIPPRIHHKDVVSGSQVQCDSTSLERDQQNRDLGVFVERFDYLTEAVRWRGRGTERRPYHERPLTRILLVWNSSFPRFGFDALRSEDVR